MTVPNPDLRLTALDGFRVEIDPARARGDIVLDRPPLNVIEMPQRDQLRGAFEALDEDPQIRIIVLRAVGEHFSSGGNISGFLQASAEEVSSLAWNIAAPARCRKLASMRSPSSGLARFPGRAAPRGCKRLLASPAPRTSSCARSASRDRRRLNGASPLNASPTTRWRRRPMRWSRNCAASRRLLSAPPRNS
jgi:hypothetical protein